MPETPFKSPEDYYEMTEMEAQAYRLTLLWTELSRKEFPDYKHTNYRKTGDPRKSLLFKYCWKLANETKGLLDGQYRLYILSQLHILKGLSLDGFCPLITPRCLCGPKAWVRWQIWKRKYDLLMARRNQISLKPTNTASIAQIKIDLEQTKAFFKDRMEVGDVEEFKKLIKNRTLLKWFAFGKISPYYVLLCPLIKEAAGKKNLDDVFLIDFNIYRIQITDEIKKLF